MTQNNGFARCPICDEDYLKSKKLLQNCIILRCECERCGQYNIDKIFESIQPPWAQVRHLVSAWVRRENRTGRIPSIGEGMSQDEIKSPAYWVNRFKHMGFPENMNEKLDALLSTLADSMNDDYRQHIVYLPNLVAEVAAKDMQEIYGLSDILLELGYLKEVGEWHVRKIRAEGWLRVDELRRAKTASDSAFIAMWFHNTTTEFREAVIAAVKYCGYKPVILDQEEYNDFVMAQIVSQIRQARFVIADFTCRPEFVENGKVKAGVRGGVYWEAGMAYGLNKPVIHTCEDSEDSKNRRHFDIDQYNTIFWKQTDLNINIRDLAKRIDNPTFVERLANRILWVVGRGSYVTG
jgi:hypothetical protein